MDDKSTDKNAERLSDIIRGVLKNRGWETKVKENRVLSIWEEVVGGEIAKNSRPKSINRGSLLVITKNPTWTQQLTMMKKKIIDKINKRFEDELVKDIKFIQGEIPDKTDELPKREEVKSPKQPKRSGYSKKNRLTEEIKDKDLREIANRILEKADTIDFD